MKSSRSAGFNTLIRTLFKELSNGEGNMSPSDLFWRKNLKR
ncbi:MAG: hypothetical protein ABI045_00420 [Flavobacteriales bacterium]